VIDIFGDGLGMEWELCGDGIEVLRGWAGTDVNGDGWGWKLNQRRQVGMGVISVPM